MDADFGLSAYHQPYNSTTTLVWDLPFGRGRRFLAGAPLALDALLGGWQIAGVNTFTAGDPVTLTYVPTPAFQVSGIQQDFRGANNYRPNVTGQILVPSGSRTVQNYLNRDTVVIPTDASQPFGNAERNSVRGPRIWTLDMQATKRVSMPWPNGTLELRIEAFNVLNRSNFRAPNGNRSAIAFGTITSTYDPRILQLAAKLAF
jgi:hypothetical protein